MLRRLIAGADVLIENFRPGTLERWGIGPDTLLALNPRLVIARVTAFGQTGPYAPRPGFGSLAEAMSGFAAVTGEVGGPPTLPPFGLADGIASLATAYAVLAALRSRDRTGRGQVIDVAILEPILAMLGGQLTIYDQLGMCRSGTATARSTTRPATATGPPTETGWPSRPRRSPLPSGCSGWWSGPTTSPSRGSPPEPAGPRTPTSWTTPSGAGSPRGTRPR